MLDTLYKLAKKRVKGHFFIITLYALVVINSDKFWGSVILKLNKPRVKT